MATGVRRLSDSEIWAALKLKEEENITWEEVGRRLGGRDGGNLCSRASKLVKEKAMSESYNTPLPEYEIDIKEPYSFSWDEAKEIFKTGMLTEKWIADRRWVNDTYCMYCSKLGTIEFRPNDKYHYYCIECKSKFTIKTGTVMHGSREDASTWMQVIYLAAMGNSVVDISKLVNKDVYAIHPMYEKIKHAWSIGLHPYEHGTSSDINQVPKGRSQQKAKPKQQTSSNNIEPGMHSLIDDLLVKWEDATAQSAEAKEAYDNAIKETQRIEEEISIVEKTIKIYKDYKVYMV